MTYENQERPEALLLWWLDSKTGKNLPAGVAFHDEKFGEYRLKIDVLPEVQYYLRPISTEGESVYFRVEVVIKRDGKFHQRKSVGEGWSNKETKGDVFITLGPYCKYLVMGLKELKK